MKIVTFTVTISCVLLAGCPATPRTFATLTCEEVEIPANCIPNGSPPEVNVNTNSLMFGPPNLCVQPGDTITFTLTPPVNNELGNVAITAKNPAHTWLNGTNSSDKDMIVIDVPAWVPIGKYNYKLYLSDSTCVDPRVQVKR